MEALRVNPVDRKRLLVASALTLVALPLLLSENRKNERDPSLAVVSPDAGLASQLQTGATSPASTSVAPATTAATVAPSLPEIKSAADLTAPPTQVSTQEGTLIPTPAIPVMQGDATWDRWNPAQVGTSSPCATPLAGLGQQVTITNLDNGRSVTCVVVDQGALPVHVVVKIDAALFQSLADLGESPIPVRITV